MLEAVDTFLFCGVQLVFLRLLPHARKSLEFTLLPLRSGYAELPR